MKRKHTTNRFTPTNNTSRPKGLYDMGYKPVVPKTEQMDIYLDTNPDSPGIASIPGRIIDIQTARIVDEHDRTHETALFSLADLRFIPGELSRKMREIDPKNFSDQIAIVCPINTRQDSYHEVTAIMSSRDIVRELPLCITKPLQGPPEISYGPPDKFIQEAANNIFKELNESLNLHPMFDTRIRELYEIRDYPEQNRKINWRATAKGLPPLNRDAIAQALEYIDQWQKPDNSTLLIDQSSINYDPQAREQSMFLSIFPDRDNPNDIFIRTLRQYILPALTPSRSTIEPIDPNNPIIKEAFIYSLTQSHALSLYKSTLDDSHTLYLIGVNEDGTAYVRNPANLATPPLTIDKDNKGALLTLSPGYFNSTSGPKTIPLTGVVGTFPTYDGATRQQDQFIVMRVNDAPGCIAEYADSTYDRLNFHYPVDSLLLSIDELVGNIEYDSAGPIVRQLGHAATTFALLGETHGTSGSLTIMCHTLLNPNESGTLAVSPSASSSERIFSWTNHNRNPYQKPGLSRRGLDKLISFAVDSEGILFSKVHTPELLHATSRSEEINHQETSFIEAKAFGLHPASFAELYRRLKNSPKTPHDLLIDQLTDEQIIDNTRRYKILHPIASNSSLYEHSSLAPIIIKPDMPHCFSSVVTSLELPESAPGIVLKAVFSNYEDLPFYLLDKHSYLGINHLQYPDIAEQFSLSLYQPLYISNTPESGILRKDSTLTLAQGDEALLQKNPNSITPVYVAIERRFNELLALSIRTSVAELHNPIAIAQLTYNHRDGSVIIDSLTNNSFLTVTTNSRNTTTPLDPQIAAKIANIEKVKKARALARADTSFEHILPT